MRRATLFALATTFICCSVTDALAGGGPERLPSERLPSERLPSKRLPSKRLPRSSGQASRSPAPSQLATEARRGVTFRPAAPALILTTLLLSAALHRPPFPMHQQRSTVPSAVSPI